MKSFFPSENVAVQKTIEGARSCDLLDPVFPLTSFDEDPEERGTFFG